MSKEQEHLVRLLKKGMYHFGRGEFEHATACWETVLVLEPQNKYALKYLEFLPRDGASTPEQNPLATPIDLESFPEPSRMGTPPPNKTHKPTPPKILTFSKDSFSSSISLEANQDELPLDYDAEPSGFRTRLSKAGKKASESSFVSNEEPSAFQSASALSASPERSAQRKLSSQKALQSRETSHFKNPTGKEKSNFYLSDKQISSFSKVTVGGSNDDEGSSASISFQQSAQPSHSHRGSSTNLGAALAKHLDAALANEMPDLNPAALEHTPTQSASFQGIGSGSYGEDVHLGRFDKALETLVAHFEVSKDLGRFSGQLGKLLKNYKGDLPFEAPLPKALTKLIAHFDGLYQLAMKEYLHKNHAEALRLFYFCQRLKPNAKKVQLNIQKLQERMKNT